MRLEGVLIKPFCKTAAVPVTKRRGVVQDASRRRLRQLLPAAMQSWPPPFGRHEIKHLVDVEDRIEQLGDHVPRPVVGHGDAVQEHVLNQLAINDDALFLAQLVAVARD